jgi:hypothetical protein
MNYVANDIGVDSGLILISDISFYDKYKGHIDYQLSKIKIIENGEYDLNWQISESWNGTISGNGILKVTTGSIIISDPCYNIPDYSEWDRVLNETHFFNNSPDGCVVINQMGGDGNYDVQFSLNKRKEI